MEPRDTVQELQRQVESFKTITRDFGEALDRQIIQLTELQNSDKFRRLEYRSVGSMSKERKEFVKRVAARPECYITDLNTMLLCKEKFDCCTFDFPDLMHTLCTDFPPTKEEVLKLHECHKVIGQGFDVFIDKLYKFCEET